MLDRNKLRGRIAEKEMTQEQVANEMGINPKTFSSKLKTGKFGLDEADKLIEILEIKNPAEIFFSQTVA